MSTATNKSLRVNTPLASTWNKLKINDITLDLPETKSTGAVFGRLPSLFAKLETGIGDEGVKWCESAAKDARYVEVTSTSESLPIVLCVGAGEVYDLGVLVREGAHAEIVVVSTAAQESSAALVRVITERGAHVSLSEFVCASGGATHLEGIGIEAGENTTIELKQYLLGGAKVALGSCVALNGRKATLEQSCRYCVGAQEILDVNHLVRARGRDTREAIVSSGFLGEGATKTLRETIDLVHGAKGSEGSESETVFIAGENVINKTLPTILCDEDDVVGNHGATIGSIGDEALGYLADRGLNRDDASALFVRAIFADALIHAKADEARKAILKRVGEVLGSELQEELEWEVKQ